MSLEWTWHPIPVNERDPRIQTALHELAEMIRRQFPEAVFDTYRGEDPDGIYLRVMVDIDDPSEVHDLVLSRLVDMQVEEGLPVYVSPRQPIERSMALLRARQERERSVQQAGA